MGDPLALVLAPPPAETVCQTVERSLYLSRDYSAEPGPIDLARTPYWREPLEMLGPDSGRQIVVVMAGVQLGKSTIGQGFLAATMVQRPAPFMIVTDTEAKAEELSRVRLDAMFRDSPVLSQLAEMTEKRRGNTILSRRFRGGWLYLTGAQTAHGLTSRTCRYAWVDEVDDHRVATGESVALALARTTSYGAARRVLIVSSPQVRGESTIESWHSRGDRRTWEVPCPLCGAWVPLAWRDADGRRLLVWPEGQSQAVVYRCPQCHKTWTEDQKIEVLPRGRWRPTCEPADPMVVSYHLSAVAAPLGWLPWSQLAGEWERAQERLVLRDVGPLRAFVTQRLAEPWEDRGGQTDAGEIVARAEDLPQIPAAVEYLTAGVDVQGDRVEAMLVGWGPGREAWILDYTAIAGDPVEAAVWTGLDAWLWRPRDTADGRRIAPVAVCVDSGHRTDHVYAYCAARRGRGVYAVKGLGGESVPVWRPRRSRGSQYRGADLHIVGTDTAKAAIHAALRIAEPGPRYIHVARQALDARPDLVDGLLSERPVRRVDRGRVKIRWEQSPLTPNEPLDCLVYAYAGTYAPRRPSATRPRPQPDHGPARPDTPAERREPRRLQSRQPRPRGGWGVGGGWR